MQLPFLAYIFENRAKVIPIITGPFDDEALTSYE
jgi:predicted class III extradiol MEMO1 family dioxygenase